MSFRPLEDDYDRTSTYHAKHQLSSKTGLIVAATGRGFDVKFPDGRIRRQVPSASGIRYEEGMQVRLERVMNDWSIVGIG